MIWLRAEILLANGLLQSPHWNLFLVPGVEITRFLRRSSGSSSKDNFPKKATTLANLEI
jgi:hypothetical protein